jgi:Fic-DOC domain mobile mystery protein B
VASNAGGPFFQVDEHASPLSEEELAGLLPAYITTREELNEAEGANIIAAETRLFPSVPDPHTVLDDQYLKRLHKQMFGDVWRWAGQYRKSQTNLGASPADIAVQVRDVVADVAAWVSNPRDWSVDEITVRFHRRLVWVHPFPNGNGRHSRLAADLLAVGLGRPRFTWGGGGSLLSGAMREEYMAALHEADDGDHARLIRFARL